MIGLKKTRETTLGSGLKALFGETILENRWFAKRGVWSKQGVMQMNLQSHDRGKPRFPHWHRFGCCGDREMGTQHGKQGTHGETRPEQRTSTSEYNRKAYLNADSPG